MSRLSPPATTADDAPPARDDPTVEPGVRRARTGVAGLDEVLGGGLPYDRLYLLDGEPGTGKTTLALQFLLAGLPEGERGLYVTLSETADELRASAASHGLSLEQLDIFELSSVTGEADEAYTLFHPAEVELQHTVDAVLEEVQRLTPARVVFDSLSEMRMLARDPLRFRRQILSLKQFFVGRRCTVLLLDDRSGPPGDMQLQSLAHGVIMLEHLALDYGAERRRLQVRKLRGVRYNGGFHDFRIRTGGIEVYPRLAPGVQQPREPSQVALLSGSVGLDALLGGGLTPGTSTLVTGAAGTGKSVLSIQFACVAATRGERAIVYLFDERIETARMRSEGLGIDMSRQEREGRLTLRQIEPTEMSPGEFAAEVVRAVEEDGVRLIVLDSINGYMQAMPSERLMGVQVHELLSYLSQRGVTIILTLVQRGVFGAPVDEAAEVSYLADAVVLMRYFEFAGSVRRAISVVKKRSGAHEHTIRECRVERGGIKVGEPLRDFRGVLTGVPEYRGDHDPRSVRAFAESPSPASPVQATEPPNA